MKDTNPSVYEKEFGGREKIRHNIYETFKYSQEMVPVWREYKKRLSVSEDAFKAFIRLLVSYVGSDICIPFRDRDWRHRSDIRNDISFLEKNLKEMEGLYKIWFWEAFEEIDPHYDPGLIKCFEVLDGFFQKLKLKEANEDNWPFVRSEKAFIRNFFVRGVLGFHNEVFKQL